MKKEELFEMLDLTSVLKKYAPTILSFLAVGGVFGTAISFSKATINAKETLDESKAESKFDKIAKIMPVYLPSIALGTATSFCILGANYLNRKKQIALAGAYSLANSTYREYSEYIQKVKAIYGQEAHEKIMKELAVEKAKDTHIISCGFVSNYSLDFEDAEEDTRLFYDSFSDRYFESTFSKVLQAEYHINRNFCLGAILSVNDFYDFLGLCHTEKGKLLGWTNSDGDYYWIDFYHYKTVLDDGLECYIIDASTTPSSKFLEDL